VGSFLPIDRVSGNWESRLQDVEGGIRQRAGHAGRCPSRAFLDRQADDSNHAKPGYRGQGDWANQLEANKQAFALAFVQRAGFPTSNDATTFVNTLFANAG